MESVAKQAFEALGPFQIVQWAVAAAILYAVWAVATRGQRDGGTKSESVPQWLLIAPAHDLIDDVSEIAEHMRRQTSLMEKIEGHMMASKVALELIRDECKMR